MICVSMAYPGTRFKRSNPLILTPSTIPTTEDNDFANPKDSILIDKSNDHQITTKSDEANKETDDLDSAAFGWGGWGGGWGGFGGWGGYGGWGGGYGGWGGFGGWGRPWGYGGFW